MSSGSNNQEARGDNPAPWERVKSAGALVWCVSRRATAGFFRHADFHLAATVAFYAVLSAIPLLFLAVSISGQVIGSSEEVLRTIGKFLEQVIPYYSQILMSEVNRISLGSGIYAYVALIFILWTGSLVFDGLEYAINQVFESRRRRSFLKAKLLSLSIFPIGGLVLILSLFLVALLGVVARLPIRTYLPVLAGFYAYLVNTGLTLLPHLILFVLFGLIFRYLPSAKVSLGQAAFGAGFCTLGWVAAKWLFGVIVLPNPNYGVVYGSLRALIILVLWIYFSICLVLYAAEIIAAFHLARTKENDNA